MSSTDPIGTPVSAVGGPGDVIGGYLARTSAVPEGEHEHALRSGDQDAVLGVLTPGDQELTGDSLVGRERAGSGDAHSLLDGIRSAVEGGGSGGGSVSAPQGDPRPITPVRESELGPLASEVGHDTGIVERFVGDFLALLDQRLDSVTASLAVADHESAVVTLRSLETTGAMLGARELVRASWELRACLGDPGADVETPLAALLGAADRVRLRLDQLTSTGASDQSGPASR
jgi:hypothetical protein